METNKIEIITMSRADYLPKHGARLRSPHAFTNVSDTALKARGRGSVFGTAVINGTPVDFYYEPYFADGYINTEDPKLKFAVATLVPAYWLSLHENYEKFS